MKDYAKIAREALNQQKKNIYRRYYLIYVLEYLQTPSVMHGRETDISS